MCSILGLHMVLLLHLMIHKLTVHGIQLTQCSLLTHTTPSYCSHLVVVMLVQLSVVRRMVSIPNRAAHIYATCCSLCDRYAEKVVWHTGN